MFHKAIFKPYANIQRPFKLSSNLWKTIKTLCFPVKYAKLLFKLKYVAWQLSTTLILSIEPTQHKPMKHRVQTYQTPPLRPDEHMESLMWNCRRPYSGLWAQYEVYKILTPRIACYDSAIHFSWMVFIAGSYQIISPLILHKHPCNISRRKLLPSRVCYRVLLSESRSCRWIGSLCSEATYSWYEGFVKRSLLMILNPMRQENRKWPNNELLHGYFSLFFWV